MFLVFHSAVSAKIMQVNVSHVQAHLKTVLHVFFTQSEIAPRHVCSLCLGTNFYENRLFGHTAFSSGRDCFWAKDVTPAHNRLRYV